MNKVGKQGKQNRFAGIHPSYKARGMSPQAIKNKRAYDKENSDNKKRALLNKANKDAGTYGNGDKLDASEKGKDKRIVMESQSKNRASKTNQPGDVRARGGKYKRLKKNNLK